MALMKQRFEPVAWLQYLAVRAAFAVMQIFPIDWGLRTARVLSRLWRIAAPRHYRRALEHLAASLGDHYGPDELKRLASRSLESVVMFAIEVVCLPRLISPSTWSRYITLRNFDVALREMLSGRGAILVTGHYGSFELMGHLIAALGFEIVSVMRPLDNRYLNEFLVRTRRAVGLALLDKKGAIQHSEEILQRGALLAFIGDQDAGRKGTFVEFFGRPASTYKSIALLAMSTGAPVVVGYARRFGNRAQYEVGVQRVIRKEEWEAQDDPMRWLTQAYTSAIEASIRDEPSQYLWIHRRWKSTPGRKRKRKLRRSPPDAGRLAGVSG